ncbi:MAG TPA: ABC transporter permease [Acidimicrobiia bacterium]|nr:ABC transporter permease [Acidimicrobiia bacterium]
MTAVVASDIRLRAGTQLWMEGYGSMLRFEMRNLRTYLTIGLVIQLALGAGMTLMYGFYFGDLDSSQVTFLVTGIPTLALIPIGFVMVPSAIMEHKLHDTYDYVWSLPVPRLSSAMATFTIFAVLGIPGMVLALLMASAIYDVDLAISWSIIPAILVTSWIGVSVGYALGHVVPEPRVISLITNIVLFLVLLFSPIVVAIEQFPDWWERVHHVLPFWHMSTVIRAALTDGMVTTSVPSSYIVLAIWGVLAASVAALVVGRRG